MTNDPRSEDKRDNQEISNAYGGILFVWQSIGWVETCARGFQGFDYPTPLFVSRTRIMNENLLRCPLAASVTSSVWNGNIPEGHAYNKYTPDMGS